MSLPDELERAIVERLGCRVLAATPVGGGSINRAWRAGLEGGERLFVKSRGDAEAAEFAAEAAGLQWLAEARGVGVPAVVARGAEPPWLALEWIEPAAASQGSAEQLGRDLASLHRAGAPAHGALPPGSPDHLLRIGALAISAAEAESWAELYSEHRLRPLLRQARKRGAIGERDAGAVERVCERIEELAGPREPPARLHGDLWSGNVLIGPHGAPYVIDPAAHGGHREIDLAMLRLFGSPGERAFAAYDEAYPLSSGHSERVELWQLLPLLVHAVLFGGSYGAAAGRAARRYL